MSSSPSTPLHSICSMAPLPLEAATASSTSGELTSAQLPLSAAAQIAALLCCSCSTLTIKLQCMW